MPLIPFLVPALVATQAPVAPQAFDRFQELLEAIPQALINGRTASMRGLVAKAKAGWDQARPEIRKAMPEPEATFIDRQLASMKKMRPVEQAMGALGISSTLSRFQPRSRKQDLLQVDRLAMAAWCSVDSGQWEPFPNVAAGFKPLIDQDKGQHTLTLINVQAALKRLDESHKKRQAVGAKKALKELLSLVDALEKA
ncbi:MAG: hypothetical protein P4L11_05725 [Geothrix sp.]|nr:hypothetical protein [Geothrix sp.]